MRCSHARRRIALVVGHEMVEPQEQEQLRQHLATCVACRVHEQRLQQSMSALNQAALPPGYEVRRSLWPKVAVRLRRSGDRQQSFWEGQKWLPMLSMAAACLLFVAVWFIPPQGAGPASPDAQRGRGMTPFPSASSPADQPLRPSWEAREADRRMKVKADGADQDTPERRSGIFP